MSKPEDQRIEQRLLDAMVVFMELESSPNSSTADNVCITNTLDVSSSGLKIMCDKPLPITSIHQLCIEISPLQFKLVGEVAWVSEEEDGCAVGLQILESEDTDFTHWKNYINKRLEL